MIERSDVNTKLNKMLSNLSLLEKQEMLNFVLGVKEDESLSNSLYYLQANQLHERFTVSALIKGVYKARWEERKDFCATVLDSLARSDGATDDLKFLAMIALFERSTKFNDESTRSAFTVSLLSLEPNLGAVVLRELLKESSKLDPSTINYYETKLSQLGQPDSKPSFSMIPEKSFKDPYKWFNLVRVAVGSRNVIEINKTLNNLKRLAKTHNEISIVAYLTDAQDQDSFDGLSLPRRMRG